MKTIIFSKPFIYFLILLASAGFIFGFTLREWNRPKVFEMYIFDLKGNEAIFIRTPNDKRILINGGANSEIIRELTNILPFYSRKIDTIISTDTDGKNVSGLIDVLKRYSVDKVILPSVTLELLGISTSTDRIYSVFLDTIKEKGIDVKKIKANDRIALDDSDATSSVFIDILFPVSAELFKYSKASGPELVMNISYGDNSITLLNNVTPKIQKFIASSTLNVSVTPEPTLPSTRLNGVERLGLVGGMSSAMGVTDALIVFNNASPDNLAIELTDKLRPNYLIYSKSLNSSSTKSASSKNEKPDPLFYLLDDHRFNLKEKGTVKIVSNGSLLEIGD